MVLIGDPRRAAKRTPLTFSINEVIVKILPTSLVLLGVVATICESYAQDITNLSDGHIAFDSIPNGIYKIEWKSTLVETNWQSVSMVHEIIATGSTTEVNVPFFYRVLWCNPPPYSITGIVRFAGTPLINLSQYVYLERLENNHVDQSVIETENGSFNFGGLSNGTYQISLTVAGYLPYQAERDLLNNHLAHNINLVVPVLPISPTNGHVQSGSGITLEWEHNPLATRSMIICYRYFPNLVMIFSGWQMYDNTRQLADLEPGIYKWRVDTSFYEQWFDLCGGSIIQDFPVGKFEDWQEFTILE